MESRFFFMLLFAIIFHSNAVQSEGSGRPSGFIDVNLYPYLSDVSNDNTMTINAASTLPKRFSYFGFVNFGNAKNASELSEFDVYYTEQNIRWQVQEASPFDLTVQLNFRSGENNDRHRLGLRWRLSDTEAIANIFSALHLKYAINWHAIQFDHEEADVWQVEHSFMLKFPYLSKRLSLSGFLDHTFNQDLPDNFPNNTVVGEAQLAYRVFKGFFIVAEYRINDYRRTDTNNLALGFEYKISW